MLLALALAGCSRLSGDTAAGDADPLGWPQSSADLTRLANEGFTIGYDARDDHPVWVAYAVTPVQGYRRMPRPDFEPDPRLARTRSPTTGLHGRYDRGHLAPNYAISQLYGDKAQRETFYYSNITAQRPRLNQLAWQRLEEIEIDDIAPRVGTLWVIVGPIMAPGERVPEAFFRVWVARDGDGRWQALAFRLPQRVRGDERLDRFIVSIDSIEAATGLDLLSTLSQVRQRRLEASPAPAATFGFARDACAPARYTDRWQGRDGIRLRYDRCSKLHD